MKISFSRDYGTVKLSLDLDNPSEDVANCQKLEKLFMSEEWTTLLTLFAAAEMKYDEAVMKVKPSEQSFRENAIYAARKNGFCEAMGLLGKAVKAYQEYRSDKRKEIDAQIDQMMNRDVEINLTNE